MSGKDKVATPFSFVVLTDRPATEAKKYTLELGVEDIEYDPKTQVPNRWETLMARTSYSQKTSTGNQLTGQDYDQKLDDND